MKRLILFAATALVSAAAAPSASSETYKLENGLTVILRPIPAATQVAVVVLFDLGGDHDPLGKSGRAHLLEHLYCTAAAGDSPARDFMAIQKRYKTGYNQQTGFDYTVFAGVVQPAQFEEELKDTAARMSDLRMADADLKREVPRVLNELKNMYGGMPSLAGINNARQKLQPIAGDGRHGGNSDHVKAITLADLKETWTDYYRPNNAILVVVGKVGKAPAKKLIEKHFAPIKAGKKPPEQPAKPKAKTGVTAKLKVKPIMPKATGVVSAGYAAPLPGTKDYPAFLVTITRLYSEIAKAGFKPGDVMPLFYPPLDDPSTIALQAALPEGKAAAEVVKELEEKLAAALKPKLTPQEKKNAVQQMAMLGTVDVPDAMWARNVYGLAFGLGRQHQLKLDGKKLAKDIEALTDADMERLAKTVFAPEKRVVAVIELEK